MLPINPEDHGLLGIQWKGEFYTDKALPFGLRSAPKIFTAVADAQSLIPTTSLTGMVIPCACGLHQIDSLLTIIWITGAC